MEYNLNFMHPQYGTIFNANVDATFNMQEMLENLVWSGFIPQNKAGYSLALQETVLAPDQTFEEVENIYDGDVIRIIQHQEEKEVVQEDTTSPSCQLFLMHPTSDMVLETTLPTDAPLGQAIQVILDKNFVADTAENLSLQQGEEVLDVEKSIEENALSPGDYLQIIQANAQTEVASSVHQLQQKLAEVQQQLHQEIALIKDNMPAANFIPIDPTRKVNPTHETYESLETIVNRLRQSSGQSPLKPIRIIPMWVIVMGSLILLGLIITLLAVFNVLPF